MLFGQHCTFLTKYPQRAFRSSQPFSGQPMSLATLARPGECCCQKASPDVVLTTGLLRRQGSAREQSRNGSCPLLTFVRWPVWPLRERHDMASDTKQPEVVSLGQASCTATCPGHGGLRPCSSKRLQLALVMSKQSQAVYQGQGCGLLGRVSNRSVVVQSVCANQ